MKRCDTCKYHKEQSYTGYYKPTPVYCNNPKEERVNYMPNRDSYCEKWEVQGE